MTFRFEGDRDALILRGVDLLGIDSDWCKFATRRELWTRLADGDLHLRHLGEIKRVIDFGELPDAFGTFLEGDSKSRTVMRIGDE